MSTTPTPRQPDASAQPANEALKEQEKAARENTQEGYGSTLKSRLISGKPDGDTQGGPGSNNDNHNRRPS